MSRELGLKQGEPRVISSSLLVMYKYIMPTFFLCTGLAGVAFLLLTPEVSRASGGQGVELPLFTPVTILLCTGPFLLLYLVPSRGVRIAGDVLLISDQGDETAVALESVSRITERRYLFPPLMTLHFRSPTALGQKVTFVPSEDGVPRHSFVTWRASPLAAELRQRVLMAGGAVDGATQLIED